MAWLYTLLIAAPLFAAATVVAQTLSGLVRNYAAARTIGVPIRFIPVSPLNPFWVLADRKVLLFLRHLPLVGSSSFVRYNWRGWEVADRYRSHQEMGDLWVLVTPFKNCKLLIAWVKFRLKPVENNYSQGSALAN